MIADFKFSVSFIEDTHLVTTRVYAECILAGEGKDVHAERCRFLLPVSSVPLSASDLDGIAEKVGRVVGVMTKDWLAKLPK